MKYGYITLGKPTSGHAEVLKGLGYGVEVVTGSATYCDHLRIRISGFVTKKVTLTGDLLKEIARRRGALTYTAKYIILGEERVGVKACGAIRTGCKAKRLVDFTALMMRPAPLPRKKGKKDEGTVEVEVDF